MTPLKKSMSKNFCPDCGKSESVWMKSVKEIKMLLSVGEPLEPRCAIFTFQCQACAIIFSIERVTKDKVIK